LNPGSDTRLTFDPGLPNKNSKIFPFSVYLSHKNLLTKPPGQQNDLISFNFFTEKGHFKIVK